MTTALRMTVTEASSGVKLIHHKKWPIKTKWKIAKNTSNQYYFQSVLWYVICAFIETSEPPDIQLIGHWLA